MGYLDSIRNSYFHKLKEILEPAFQGKATIVEPVDEYKNIAVLKHAFGEIPISLVVPGRTGLSINSGSARRVKKGSGSAKIKFEKFGTFETWEEGRALAEKVIKRIDAFHNMSISNMAVLEEKWLRIDNALTKIWQSKPGETLKYSVQDSSAPFHKKRIFKCTHEKGSEFVINLSVSKTDHIMAVEVEVTSRAVSAWEESLRFHGKSTTRHTRKLDGVFEILNLVGEQTKSEDIQSNFNHDNRVLMAYALGIGSPTKDELSKVLVPIQRPTHDNRYHRLNMLKELDPNGDQKIHTDYGIAGYVFTFEAPSKTGLAAKQRMMLPARSPRAGDNKLIVQLFDMPMKYEMIIPIGGKIDQTELLKNINSSFEKQFLKFRSRDHWAVDPKKGRFESFDQKLSNIFTISESIEADVFSHVKKELRDILSSHKLDDITIEPGKKLPKHFIIAKLKKPGSSFWIVLGRGGAIYVKPGGFSGKQIWINSDQQFAEEIIDWHNSEVSKRHIPKISYPQSTYAPPPSRPQSNERWPGQEKFKEIEQSKYFPRTVYHRKGAVPGGGLKVGRTPFMLSIHAAESLIDFKGEDEKGKLPAGLFTGLDHHLVSASGIRPGHVGWIGGYYDDTTLNITEVQSDIMQRTWDLLDRSKRDEDTSVGSGKKKQLVRSQKHRIREIASELKQARVELAQMQQKDYGNLSEKYKLLERIQKLNSQLNASKMSYKKFTRMPMFSQHKSSLENMFKNWIQAFYADAFNFARSKDISEIKIISTDGIQGMHTNVNIGKDRESSIYHRLYDKIAMELGANKKDTWWSIPLKSIPKTESLDNRIKNLINEAIYGNKATVFHKTGSPDKILSIAKWGFFPSLSGAHGRGLYAVFDPDRSKNMWLQSGSYGNFVVKMAVDLRNNILILDRDEAKKFYGDNYKISDQLTQMGVNWRRQDMSEFDQWELHKKADYTDVEQSVMQMDDQIEKGERIPPNAISFSAIRFDVNGIFFVGPHGYELVGFDTSIYKPLGFSNISKNINSINDLTWHKFDQEGIDFIYSVSSKHHSLPPKSHWYKQL